MKKLQAFGVVLAALLVGMSTTVVVAATESSDGYWTERASMATARDHPGVVGVDGKIYVFGGSDASGTLDSVEVYDPTTDTWTPGPPMPGAKNAPSAVEVGGLIYVLGGDESVYCFDPVHETWSVKAPVPESFVGPAAVAALDGKIYLARTEQWMYYYDPTVDSWTARTPVPVERSIASFAVLNGRLYAIGGGEPGHVPSEIDRIDVYDPASDSWTIGGAAPLGTRRTHLGSPMPVVNGKIYVIGGWNGYTALTSVEEYDPSTDSWRYVAPMPTARYAIGYGVLGNKVYAIGGNYGGAGGHWQARNDEFTVPSSLIEVSIDIKPGSYRNPINPRSRGKIPVAILSSPDFDVPSEVVRDSLTFGRTGDEDSLAFCSPSSRDINYDGLYDLVCHFYTQKTGFQAGDTEGILKGWTVDGVPIEGRDLVSIVPKRK